MPYNPESNGLAEAAVKNMKSLILRCADRYSGYEWSDKLKDTSTATVTAKLNSWFVEYGYPEHICTDGGPQF